MKKIKRLFRKTIVMDANIVPSEYRDSSGEVDIQKYEDDFNVNIVLIDMSRKNTGGVNNFVPYKL